MARRQTMQRLGKDIHLAHLGRFYATCACGWKSRVHESYHSACMAKASHTKHQWGDR